MRRRSEKNIIFTDHARIRADFRNIDLEEIKENILNPKKLFFVKIDEERSNYGCYFKYSKTHCHKYVLVLNSNVIIVTVININRSWQKNLR